MTGFYTVQNNTNGVLYYSSGELAPGAKDTFFLDEGALSSLRVANIKVDEAEKGVKSAKDFNGVDHSADEVKKLQKERQERIDAEAKAQEQAEAKTKEKGKEMANSPDQSAPTENTKDIVGAPGVGINTGPGAVSPDGGTSTPQNPPTPAPTAPDGGSDGGKAPDGNSKNNKK